MQLDKELSAHYEKNKARIRARLNDFKQVPKEDYFYEFCFCLCTPQSKAASALQVQNKLKELNFLNNPFYPVEILAVPEHYIRFHNQKAKRIQDAASYYPKIQEILDSESAPKEKRMKIYQSVNGFGMKEASHFMRNIGYEGLSILDRHILRNLVKLGVFADLPNISTVKNYLSAELAFLSFADEVAIPIDELDLLFWSFENGDIIK